MTVGVHCGQGWLGWDRQLSWTWSLRGDGGGTVGAGVVGVGQAAVLDLEPEVK